MLYSNSKRVDAERMSSEIISLKDRQEEAYLASFTEKDAIIKELENQLVHVSALAKRNGAV